MDKIFLVYYINLPIEINKLPLEDKHIVVNKEGVKDFRGAKFARSQIRIVSVSNAEDKSRTMYVKAVLDLLRASGKIVDFTE